MTARFFRKRQYRFKLYLDTCIFVACYDQKDGQNQHRRALQTLEKATKSPIDFYTSDFTFAEFFKSILDKKVTESRVMRYYTSLFRDRKILQKYKFTILDTEGEEENYGFDSFFVDVSKMQVDTKPRLHLADSLHAVIMNNNRIKHILTFNKDDFKNIENIEPITPEDMDDFIKAIKKHTKPPSLFTVESINEELKKTTLL